MPRGSRKPADLSVLDGLSLAGVLRVVYQHFS